MSHDHPSPWSPSGQHQQQGWPAPPPVPQPTPQPAWAPEPQPFAAPVAAPPIEVRLTGQPGQGRGLAITGVVLGGLALAGWLLVGLSMLGFFFFDDEGPGVGGYGTPQGTVAPAQDGALKGATLASEVTRSVSDTGGLAEGVTCPDTAKVAQDVTTVCHGTDYGDEATFVVFFEDAQGRYTLLEI